jgi:anti-sigma factor RsiW
MSIPKHEHSPADPPRVATCQEVFERLSEYLDGELSPQECAKMQAHLRDCGPCVDFVESLRKSIYASHGLRSDEPVSALPEETRENLRAAWKAALQRLTI